MKSKSGFTLVELLIVIVVIAILASISVVAYSGVQERAVRSSVASSVSQWDKVVKLFISEHGQRPQGQWSCFGTVADLPADGDFPAGACVVRSSDGGSTWVVENAVDANGVSLGDQLAPYVNGKVSGAHQEVRLERFDGTKVKMRGLIYDDYSVGRISLVYLVPGDSCVGEVWRTAGGYKDGLECYYEIMRADGLSLAN